MKIQNYNHLKNIIFITVIVLTGLFFRKFDNWKPQSDNLILNGGFELNYKHWTPYGGGKNYLQTDDGGSLLILNNQGKSDYCGIYQEFIVKPMSTDLYLLKADISVKIHEKSKRKWNSPYIMILQKDYMNQINWEKPVFFTLLNKNKALFKLRRTIKLLKSTEKLIFLAGIENSNSTLSLNNLEFYSAKRSKHSANFRSVLLLLNILAFILVLYFIPSNKNKIIFVSCLVLILFGMSVSNEKLQFVTRLIKGLFSCENIKIGVIKNPLSPLNYIYLHQEILLNKIKAIAHFLSFFIITCLAFNIYRNVNFIKLTLNLFIFAWFTEQFQYFTLTRLPFISSFLINIAGIIAGIILTRILKRNTKGIWKVEKTIL